ncbi:helix-turn-helix transcriptional regulator [Rothia kristinae]|uniref:helix-turn-helix domain-containing protein n=1 Tax=Actinomycetes TaxID=1760 RepID=UPI003443E5A6
MGKNKTSVEPGPYALAVRAEILAELGRRGITPNSLAGVIGRGSTYLNSRLTNAYKELSLNDIEAICEAIGADIGRVMENAERTYQEAVAPDLSVAAPTVLTEDDVPNDWDLAADQHKPGDEPDYDNY